MELVRDSKEAEVLISSTEVIPGAASLLEHTDKKIGVWLRDGRQIVGTLRSVDQFANLVLYPASERVHMDGSFGDIPQGIVMIRGENVALLGEMEKDDEKKRCPALKLLSKQVTLEQSKKEKNAEIEMAYWKDGRIFSFEDYF
ncbi:hypothetical protein JTE90_028768 [Oedothorax gibbosus]|uniref:U6 snRNA-associated Sm-like protein LSm1 n=1 Tax=Oedothorax gibbosus TaxID=931172 RepID=A0AAV6VYG5_9ARAC|nr:hypothetical protein JTE90_028768 [Oedothorax gibbosus]